VLVIVGYVVILISVFGGFALAGGHLASLWQPVELLMIGGGAVARSLSANNSKAIKATLKALPTVFKGSKYSRALYMDMMALLYELADQDPQGRVDVGGIRRRTRPRTARCSQNIQP